MSYEKSIEVLSNLKEFDFTKTEKFQIINNCPLKEIDLFWVQFYKKYC